MAPTKTKTPLGAIVEFLANGEAIGRGQITKISNLDVLHNSRMPKGCYGVSVLEVYEGMDAPLPHINPMDEDTQTLRAAVGTVVAWPKDNLKFFNIGRQDDTSSKTILKVAVPQVKVTILSQVNEESVSKLSPTTGGHTSGAEKGKTKGTRSGKRKPKPLPDSEKGKEPKPLPDSEKGKEKATCSGKAAGSGKGRATKSAGREETHTEKEDSDEELQEAELDAYIQEGAKAGVEFPLNKDLTLRQDMLSVHLQKLRDEREMPLPWVPLCRLMKLEKARQVSWDPKRLDPLANSFIAEGYYEPKGSFICSVDAPGFPTIEVTDEITKDWDQLWKESNEEFERKIAGTCWKDLARKMLYTWDGNHRLTAWKGVTAKCMLSLCFV